MFMILNMMPHDWVADVKPPPSGAGVSAVAKAASGVTRRVATRLTGAARRMLGL